MPDHVELAAGTLQQFARTGDGCFIDNADADTLRDMLRITVTAILEHRSRWKGAGVHWRSNEQLWAAVGVGPPGQDGWTCPGDLSRMDADDPACLLCGRARV